MFEGLVVGQTVVIQIVGKTLMGQIRLIGKNGKRIKLANTTDIHSQKVYDGEINFFSADILSLRVVGETKDLDVTEKTDTICEKETKLFQDFSIGLQKKIDFVLSRISYIKEPDKLYHDAIKDLSVQSKVSLTIESCAMGRNSLSATLITFFSTGTKRLYIFDMQFLRNLCPKFRNIFIQKQPLKILYDGRYVNDYLSYTYEIELNGISDTLVGHLLISKKDEEISFMECLMRYFNLPKNYLKDDNTVNWIERPLKPELMKLTAKKAVLNYLLHQFLLEEGLLKKYYDACDSFSKRYSRNKNFGDVAMKMSSGDVAALEEVIGTDVELSCDLSALNI